jgi:hypothetical protein
MSRLGRRTVCVFPPLVLSLAAKARGGRGHRVVCGRVVGEVKAGLIWLEGERSRWAVFSWVVASLVILSDS